MDPLNTRGSFFRSEDIARRAGMVFNGEDELLEEEDQPEAPPPKEIIYDGERKILPPGASFPPHPRRPTTSA